ncbi:hypothetical protein KPL74_20065 [Bacillus sp. NP157]|nr:hypothetical protein KPL74_20065 [Bacillus sp. NP157]
MWLALLVLVATPAMAASAGTDSSPMPFGPWTFGMTKDQVTAITDHGPYKSFSNGDLETYAGTFDGKPANVQFYFRDDKVVRMEVLRYEGKSAKDAARAFGDTFGVLQSLYGAIETSQMASPTPGKPMDAEGLVAASATQVDLHGKAQMAPVKQPPGAFVFSTFRKDIVQGDVYFYVYVMYDPPQR